MKFTSKLMLMIFNAVIGLLCIFAIFGYIAKPVWEVTLTVTFNESLAKKLYPQAYESDTATDEDSNSLINDVIKELAQTNTELSTSLCLNSKHFYNAIFTNSAKPVDDILADVVDNALNSEKIDMTLDNIIKNAAKSATKAAVKTTLDELKNNVAYDFNTGDKDTDTVMNEIGFTDEYIDSKTDVLYDALTSDNTVESITNNTIMPMVDEIYTMIKNSEYGNELPDKLADADRAELESNITDALKEISYDNNGSSQVNIKNNIYKLISDAFDNDEATVAVNDNMILLAATVDEATESDTSDDEQVSIEDLKQSLKDKLMNSVSDSAKNVLLICMKAVAAVLIFSMLTWLYLLIKILVKTFSAKPGVKLKLPILLGWLPYLPLVLIPSVIINLVTSPNGFIAQSMPADSLEEIQSLFEAVSIRFSSGASFAFIAAIALIVLFIPYGIFRRRSKREE